MRAGPKSNSFAEYACDAIGGNPPQSDTPETDAAAWWQPRGDREVVEADVSRSLERRLREALADAEIHLEAANRWSERAEAVERRLRESWDSVAPVNQAGRYE